MSKLLISALAISVVAAIEHPLLQRQAPTPAPRTCLYPPDTTVPTGAPLFPETVMDYFFHSVSDTCGLATAPPFVSSALSSYTSACSIWVAANHDGLQSYVTAVQSYQSSEAMISSCASWYSGSNTEVITGQTFTFSDFIPDFTFPCRNGNDISTTGTTQASVTASASVNAGASSASGQAVSMSSSSAAIPGVRSGSAPMYSVFVGGGLAVVSFIAMLAL